MIVRLLRLVITLYRLLISPVIGPNCRFIPSCSEYALDAMAHHGVWGGLWLWLRRVLRCHPWAPGGIDPVPLAKDTSNPRCEVHQHAGELPATASRATRVREHLDQARTSRSRITRTIWHLFR